MKCLLKYDVRTFQAGVLVGCVSAKSVLLSVLVQWEMSLDCLFVPESETDLLLGAVDTSYVNIRGTGLINWNY